MFCGCCVHAIGPFSYLLKALRQSFLFQCVETQYGQPDSPFMYFLSVYWNHFETGVETADFCKKIVGEKWKVASQRNTGENKKVLQKVDIAEALTKPGGPYGAHQHMVTL